jgi:hypothetical protein
MEPIRNEKFSKEFDRIRKESEERSAIYKEIGTGVANFVKEFRKYGKEIEQETKRILQNYFNDVQIKIEKFNDPGEICRFLIKEKGKYNGKVIEANFNKNGYIEKDYQAVINQIIDPLLKHYELVLAFEKKNPSIKQTVSAPIITKPVIVKNGHIINTNPLHEKQKNSSTNIKAEDKLPDGFKQIESDATKEEIVNYFMIFSKEKNPKTDEFYMKKSDVEEFVKKNFLIFGSPPINKYFPIAINPFTQKAALRYFIYQFFMKYDCKKSADKMKYVKLLINNFEVFKDDDLESLSSNFSKAPSKKNSIPISKYL